MAIEIYDEHEQGERVRDWLRRNAVGLLAGILLGLALIGGWQWWQKHQITQKIEAGARYQAVVDAVEGGDLAMARTRAEELPGGALAALAALDLARAQLEAGEPDAAIATLSAVGSADPAIEPIRRQRLGMLLIETGRAGEAVELLAGSQDAASLETLGDAQFALERHEEARQAWESALRQLDVSAPQRRLVELKIIDVGGAPAQPEAI